MKFINEFIEGDNITGVYLCRQKNTATTKNGKDYDNLILADKTGTINAKIWEPGSMGIGDFSANDYIEIHGRVSVFNGTLQLSIDRAFKANEGSYRPSDYLPVSPRDPAKMLEELDKFINSVNSPYFRLLLDSIFVDDVQFREAFAKHSAAKSVHHGFVGGLIHHTLSVASICHFFAKQYPIINRDLLITAALCHDIGKVRELSAFPLNDYTNEGQLLGHIMIGAQIVSEKIREINGFPKLKAEELIHCILAHHGEYEYGSPKKPAIIEAVALNFADNADAKIEAMTEILEGSMNRDPDMRWLGFNRIFDSNIRPTD